MPLTGCATILTGMSIYDADLLDRFVIRNTVFFASGQSRSESNLFGFIEPSIAECIYDDYQKPRICLDLH